MSKNEQINKNNRQMNKIYKNEQMRRMDKMNGLITI